MLGKLPHFRLATALLLGATAFAAAPGTVSAATYAEPAPHHWAGYRIPVNGHADGGWIGGWQVGKKHVFVVTPRALPNRAGFNRSRPVADLRGTHGPTRRETRRAAWVLSKYGGYRDATQAAAVDASVYHLLAGGRWKITHARGARRIRLAGSSSLVHRFARIMLRQSRRSAGVYTARVRATNADVGGTITATVRVRDGHGRPAAGLPVTLRSARGKPVTRVTGGDGRAMARFPAPVRGWQKVTARVRQVPDHRIHLRTPVRPRQATAAAGGSRRTVVARTRAAVRGPQTLTLESARDVILVGSRTKVVATVGGDSVSRTATATLYGPFASASGARCSGASVDKVSTTVSDDGSYNLPRVTPTAGGFYLWRVRVDGSATNLKVAACGASTKVRALSRTRVSHVGRGLVGGDVRARVTVSRIPFPARVVVTTTLFGPYSTRAERRQDACGRIYGRVVQTLSGNGSLDSTPLVANSRGYFAWQAETSAGELWLGSRSTCLARGTRMRVR